MYFVYYDVPWQGGSYVEFKTAPEVEGWLMANKKNTGIRIIKGEEIKPVKMEVVMKWKLED